MTSSGRSLQELFLSAKHKQEQLSDLDPRSDAYKELQHEIIQELLESRNLVTKAAMFSVNEEVEDISTQDIAYLGTDYLLAEMLLKSYEGDRQQTLQNAARLFDEFLTRLDQYSILSASDKKLYEQFQETPASFTLAASSNAEERRRVKVARFQEEKSLKARLEYLRNKSKSITTDDEVLRSLYLAELALYSSQTFQSLDMVTQENAILAQMRTAEPSTHNGVDDGRQATRASASEYSERLDGPTTLPGLGGRGPLLDKSGKPLQPFTLTDKRTQLKEGVFRSGHNLPTMSIDEYLEEEKRRGGIINSNSGANSQTVEFDEDNDAHADAATMKAREWDEFVEANPKGAGNTINRG